MQNNNWLKKIGFVVLVVIISLITVRFSTSSNTATDSAADRVIDSGEIRAGYVVYPPQMIKDPNTGELSGIFHDALETAGANLGVKVNWVEEVSWGTMIEGLKSGRYDIVGSPVWPSSERARQADFTKPLSYSVFSVIARANDTRFDTSFSAINNPNVKISIIDGEISQTVAKEQFPNAGVTSLPQSSDITQSFLNVSTGKADIAFAEPQVAESFIKNNPGKIKIVQVGNPLRVYGNVMMIAQGQEVFKAMLNVALEEQINSGHVDTLIEKYQTLPRSYYPIAKPFSLPR